MKEEPQENHADPGLLQSGQKKPWPVGVSVAWVVGQVPVLKYLRNLTELVVFFYKIGKNILLQRGESRQSRRGILVVGVVKKC